MPIFQPIVNTTPTPIGVQQPLQQGGVAGAIAQGISDLAGVGLAYIASEGEKTSWEKQATELFIKAGEALRTNDDRATSARLQREARVLIAANGGNAGAENWQELARSQGLDFEYGVYGSEEEENEARVRATPQFEVGKILALSRLGQEATSESIDRFALRYAQTTIVREAQLNELNTSADITTQEADLAMPQLIQAYRDSTESVLVALNLAVTQQQSLTISDVEALEELYRNSILEVKASQIYTQATNKDGINAIIENTEAQIGIIKEMVSIEGITARTQEGVYKTLQYIENNKDQFSEDLVKSVNRMRLYFVENKDSGIFDAMIQTDVPPSTMAKFFEVFEEIDTIKTQRAVAAEARDDTPGAVPPWVQRVSNRVDFMSKGQLLEKVRNFSILFQGSPQSVRDNTEYQETVAAEMVYIAEAIKKFATPEVGVSGEDWISSSDMQKLFDPRMSEYWQELQESNPRLAAQVYRELLDADAKYHATVQRKLTTIQEKTGVVFDRDTGEVSIDEDSIIAATGLRAEQVAIIKENLGRLGAESLLDIMRNPKAFARDYLKSLNREDQMQLAPLTSALNRLANTSNDALDAISDPEIKDMIQSGIELDRALDRFQQETTTFTPISYERFSAISPVGDSLVRLLPHIDVTEGVGNYDTLYDQSQKSGGRWQGVRVSRMTIDQVLEMQRGEYGRWVQSKNDGEFSSPAGRYQIVGDTLERLKENLGLRGTELFNKSMQDYLFSELVKGRVARSRGDVNRLLTEIRAEWVGLKKVDDEVLLPILQDLL